ncbi:hypothetical protein AMECASPLE_021552 [Ameca splendens]|uniref:Uncharacterized protein n=1 Tax=Ameca splendens TaxID=208324 RepID=A0ABV0Z1Z9_9TELE
MEREAAQRQRVREGCFVPPPQLRRYRPASVPAAKPSFSSCRSNRRRAGVPSQSAGEEVVSLSGDVRAVGSKPASSPATALSARLAAAPPMPSSLAPARCSEAIPDELEQRLRFFARHIKSLRKTSLSHHSFPELMERSRQVERDYETAVRLFYCCPPSPTPSHMSAAAEQPTSGLQSAAAEQPDTPQPDPKSASAHVTEGPADASASATEGSPGSTPPEFHRVFGGASTLLSRPPRLWCRSGRPPKLCACWGRPPGRPPELCSCFCLSIKFIRFTCTMLISFVFHLYHAPFIHSCSVVLCGNISHFHAHVLFSNQVLSF